MPLISTKSQAGSVWAVYVLPEYRKRGIGAELMKATVEYWKKIGCLEGHLLYASDEGRRVYERVGFSRRNVLMLDIPVAPFSPPLLQVDMGLIADDDDIVANVLQLTPEDLRVASARELVHKFIDEGRKWRDLETFVIRREGKIVASVCCLMWSGPLPLVFHEKGW